MVNAFTLKEKKLIVDYIESKSIKVVESIDIDKRRLLIARI